ncbi:MAG TPA: hypothetical protein VIN34_03215 [Candidatus Limnocylindria bacterium]
MTRRRALVAILLVALSLTAGGATVLAAAHGGGPPAERVERAVAAMEALRGVRFTFEATSRASGEAPVGGELVTTVRGNGELAPPDRLHLAVEVAGMSHDIVLSGDRAWVDGRRVARGSVGPLGRPLAALEAIRGAGTIRALGLGWAGGVTARFQIALGPTDLLDRLGPGAGVAAGSSGVIEVHLGLFDDRIRAHSFRVLQAAEGADTGLDRVETSYRLDYAAWDVPVTIREPE